MITSRLADLAASARPLATWNLRRWLVVVMAFWSVAGAGPARAQGLWQDPAFALYREAAEALNKGDYAAADSLAAQAIARYPNHLLAHYLRGQAAAAQSRWDGAAAEFTRVVELYPGSVAGYASLARATEELGRVDDAARAYETALKLKPGDDALRSRLGIMLLRAGREPQALPLLRDLADRNTTVPEVWIALGRLSFDQNDLPAAEKAFARATTLRDDGPVWYDLGIVRFRLGNRAGALQAYERALTHAETREQAAKEIARLKTAK
jgi:tetratricopeptide (TPR) repeat protein